MIEMLFRQIFDNKLLDEEFCEYLEKNLDSKVNGIFIDDDQS